MYNYTYIYINVLIGRFGFFSIFSDFSVFGRFFQVSADRIVTGQPEPVPNWFCQPENDPESVSGHPECSLTLLIIRSGTSSKVILSARNRPESVPGYQNAAGFCSESGLDNWNQIKITSISQKLSRMSSRTPRTARFWSESSPDSRNQFKMI